MTHWSNAYIGLPWLPRGADRDGLDCYGLVRLIYWERAGLRLPSYAGSYVTAEEREEIAALVSGVRAQGPWVEIAPGDEWEFDVALFRIGALQSHVALVVEPGLALHISEGHDSEIIRYRDSRWASRLAGFLRHAALMERPLVG